MKKIRYIAFLRGINVGGNKKVPMTDLKKSLESLGFKNVKTLLNSGNVAFDTDQPNTKLLQSQVEQQLLRAFGFEIRTIIRTQIDIQKIVHEDPFKNIQVVAQTRLYVTLLSELSQHTLKIPYESVDGGFKILKISENNVFSVVTLSDQKNTTDVMKFLEKEFGKNITTRNWNTILKIAQI